METLISDRLIEMTFAPLEEIATWLARLGLEIRRQEETLVVVRNPHLNVVTAILADSDPVTKAVCLATVTVGLSWPAIYPRLLERVNRRWRRQSASPPSKTTFADLYRTNSSD
jgi:hypothetical protein